ncbi:MAG: hypothetical protein H0U71_03280 [Gammaproteobacteria bacterium]|nr:hypothetical protein [Gammaproteobacteria bacterium]
MFKKIREFFSRKAKGLPKETFPEEKSPKVLQKGKIYYHPPIERSAGNYNIPYAVWGNVENLEDAQILFIGSYHVDEVHSENAKLVYELFQKGFFPNGATALCENMPSQVSYSSNYKLANTQAVPMFENFSALRLTKLKIMGWDCDNAQVYNNQLSNAADDLRSWIDIGLRNESLMQTIGDEHGNLANGAKLIVDAGRGHFVDCINVGENEKKKFTKEFRRFIKSSNYKYAFFIPMPPEDLDTTNKIFPKLERYYELMKPKPQFMTNLKKQANVFFFAQNATKKNQRSRSNATQLTKLALEREKKLFEEFNIVNKY